MIQAGISTLQNNGKVKTCNIDYMPVVDIFYVVLSIQPFKVHVQDLEVPSLTDHVVKLLLMLIMIHNNTYSIRLCYHMQIEKYEHRFH